MLRSDPDYILDSLVLHSSGATGTWGLPSDTSVAPVGVNTTWLEDQVNPLIFGIDQMWEGVKTRTTDLFENIEMVVTNAPNDVLNGVKATYNLGVSGVDAVVDDATDIVAAPLKAVFWYGAIALIVVGGVIYFAGKSGAIGQSASLVGAIK